MPNTPSSAPRPIRTHAPRTRQKYLISLLFNMHAVRVQRRRLGQLDAQLLCDIGLTRTQATAEANRPPWDTPSHWYR